MKTEEIFKKGSRLDCSNCDTKWWTGENGQNSRCPTCSGVSQFNTIRDCIIHKKKQALEAFKKAEIELRLLETLEAELS